MQAGQFLLLLVAALPLITGTKPNFLILYADDLGIGDIGCFGNDTIRTPHVDSMCRDGAKLSHHTAAAAICTPSRAAFMTGRLPVRSGMAAWHDVGVIWSFNSYAGLPTNETTFPKLLQEQGYKTGLIGKWHLGLHADWTGSYEHHPTRHGFDYFFGTPITNHRALGPDADTIVWAMFPNLWRNMVVGGLCGVLAGLFLYRKVGLATGLLVAMLSVLAPCWMYTLFTNTHRYNSGFWRNEELVEQPINFDAMSLRLVNEGVGFLRDRKADGQPFMLMMSWLQVHTFLHADAPFKGDSAHGPYGDEVEELDWSVGQMLEALRSLGLEDNTLVYFSSDNGGHIEEHDMQGERAGGHNGIYRGSKVQGGQEGGIRVPSAMVWPGHISAGSDVTEPTSQMDIFSTFVRLAGGKEPSDRTLDGRDIMPLVLGKESVSPHRFMFHYCCMSVHSVRYRPETGSDIYKLHYHWPDWDEGTTGCASRFACACYTSHSRLSRPKLYNIAQDPAETTELDITQSPYREIVSTIDRATAEHVSSVEPVPNQFDRYYTMYRPWMHYHTCCNFPFCDCDDANNALHAQL